MESADYIYLTLISLLLLTVLSLSWKLLRKKQMSLLDQYRILLTQERHYNQRLTSLLLSKDPMTFSTLLSQSGNRPSISDGYSPTGTDEAEAQRYADLMSAYPVGEEISYEEDFRDSGILRDGG